MVSVAQKFSACIELIVNRQNLKTRELNFVIQFWPDRIEFRDSVLTRSGQ